MEKARDYDQFIYQRNCSAVGRKHDCLHAYDNHQVIPLIPSQLRLYNPARNVLKH